MTDKRLFGRIVTPRLEDCSPCGVLTDSERASDIEQRHAAFIKPHGLGSIYRIETARAPQRYRPANQMRRDGAPVRTILLGDLVHAHATPAYSSTIWSFWASVRKV